MAGAGLPSFDDTYVGLLQQLEMLRFIHYVQRSVVAGSVDIVTKRCRDLTVEEGLKAGRQQSYPTLLPCGGCGGADVEEMRTEKDYAASGNFESLFSGNGAAGYTKSEYKFFEGNRDRKFTASNGWKLDVKDTMCIRNIGKRGLNFYDSFDEKIKCMEERISDDAAKVFPCNTKLKSPILDGDGGEAKQNLNYISGDCSSFRKRKRKQESEKIYRVNGEKFEKENVVENIKAKECLEFLKYFTEELGKVLPNEIVVNGSASGSENMELCKRIAQEAGQLIREKNLLLEEEYNRIGQLEQALSKEQALKNKLSSELVSLKERLHSVLSAAEQGSKSNCAYCSSILGELGDQNSQEDVAVVLKSLKIEHITSSEAVEIFHPHVVHGNVTPTDLASKERLTSNSGVLNNIFSLEPTKREMDGQTCEEKGKVKKSKTLTKSDGLLKGSEREKKGAFYSETKSSSVLSKFQGSKNVTEMCAQRDFEGIVDQAVQLGGKQGNKKNRNSLAMETEHSEGIGNEIEEEDDAVESKESQRKCKTLKVNEEEHDGSIEDSEGTRVCNNEGLTKILLELKNGNQFVEMKCGCTSQKYGDTVGTLRVYQTGIFEIYCECMTGCEKGKPMTPAAFEKHGGRGSSRKWRYSIWVLVGDRKIQLSRVKILEPYYLKYKAMKTTRGTELRSIRQAYHRDEFVCCSKCHKERRFKRRNKEECRIYHDALANTKWECSNFPYDRCLTCRDDEEREVRRAVRGCTHNRVCAGCIECVCLGCHMCCFPDCSCRTCIEFISNSNL